MFRKIFSCLTFLSIAAFASDCAHTIKFPTTSIFDLREDTIDFGFECDVFSFAVESSDIELMKCFTPSEKAHRKKVLSSQNENGKNPLDLAKEKGDNEIIKFLKTLD